MWQKPQKQCFRHFDVRFIPQPEVTEKGFRLDPDTQLEVKAEDVIGWIDILHTAQPDRSAFDICRMLRVCPTGLVSPDDWEVLALEGAAREYGASYLKVAGYDPAPAVVLDAMQVIRTTRNEVEARRLKRAQTKGGRP